MMLRINCIFSDATLLIGVINKGVLYIYLYIHNSIYNNKYIYSSNIYSI